MTALLPLRPPEPRQSSQSRDVVDCAGARLSVEDQTIATVLRVEGDIDACNAARFTRAVQRLRRQQIPLIIDLSRVGFIDIAGYRAVLVLGNECHNAGSKWRVVSGTAMSSIVRCIPDHGLPLAESVSAALKDL